MAWVLFGLWGCGVPGHEEVVTLRELGLVGTLGVVEQESPLATFTWVRDASFFGEEVLVLDAAPPFVRVFDRNGRFVRALVGKGEGPTEMDYTVDADLWAGGGREFVLRNSRGVRRFDSTGELLQSVQFPPWLNPRGAVEGCGQDLLVLAQVLRGQYDTAAVLRMPWAGDTLRRLYTTHPRLDAPRMDHPWFAKVLEGGLLFYTEEKDRPRIVGLTCDGVVDAEFALDSLGPPRQVTIEGEGVGQSRVRRAQPPFPGGLLRLGDRILWAHHTEIRRRRAVDSVTVITSYTPDGRRSGRIHLEGWYRLADASQDGLVLLTNAYTMNRSYGVFPGAYLVLADSIVSSLDSAAESNR